MSDYSMNKYAMFYLCLFLALASCAWAEDRTIIVTNGDRHIEFKLNDTSTAVSLWNQLPFSANVENYGNNEKIFHPSEALDTTNIQEGNCPVGTLAYFSPWGNLVMYYGPASRYPGLYILGHAVSGAEDIGNISGTINLTKADGGQQDEEERKEESPNENSSKEKSSTSGSGGCNAFGSLAAPLGLFAAAKCAGKN